MSLDPVRIQIGIRLKKRAPITYDFLRGVVAHWADGGKLPRGIQIVYVRWINPVRARVSLAKWKDSRDSGQSLQGARKTLRGLLQSTYLNISFPEDGTSAKPVFKRQPIRKTKTFKRKPTTRKAVKKQKKHKLRNVRRSKGVRK